VRHGARVSAALRLLVDTCGRGWWRACACTSDRRCVDCPVTNDLPRKHIVVPHNRRRLLVSRDLRPQAHPAIGHREQRDLPRQGVKAPRSVTASHVSHVPASETITINSSVLDTITDYIPMHFKRSISTQVGYGPNKRHKPPLPAITLSTKAAVMSKHYHVFITSPPLRASTHLPQVRDLATSTSTITLSSTSNLTITHQDVLEAYGQAHPVSSCSLSRRMMNTTTSDRLGTRHWASEICPIL
jgi:hypothetical protein